MHACLSSGGKAARRNMAIGAHLNRWAASSSMSLFCTKTFDKASVRRRWLLYLGLGFLQMWRLTTILRNVGHYYPDDTASHYRRLDCCMGWNVFRNIFLHSPFDFEKCRGGSLNLQNVKINNLMWWDAFFFLRKASVATMTSVPAVLNRLTLARLCLSTELVATRLRE